jgi:hypothetical protein
VKDNDQIISGKINRFILIGQFNSTLKQLSQSGIYFLFRGIGIIETHSVGKRISAGLSSGKHRSFDPDPAMGYGFKIIGRSNDLILEICTVMRCRVNGKRLCGYTIHHEFSVSGGQRTLVFLEVNADGTDSYSGLSGQYGSHEDKNY